MIIWRGWGILGLFVTLAGVFGSLTVVEALLGTSESALALGGGIGFLPVSYTHLTLPTNREV